MPTQRLDNIALTPNQRQALDKLRRRLLEEFEIEDLVLFGSAARGEADEESDIDILIITKHAMTRPARHEITDVVFEINLEHDTNFSTLVVDRESWEAGPIRILPIHEGIELDGVPLRQPQSPISNL